MKSELNDLSNEAINVLFDLLVEEHFPEWVPCSDWLD